MSKSVVVIVVLILASFFVFILVSTRGCPVFTQSIGRFYPESASLEQEGSFQPSIKFFEATGVEEKKQGIDVPTIVCPKAPYAANTVRISVADVTGVKGYDRFNSVVFTYFKIEYDSGGETVFVSPDSSTREFAVCDGAYAHCGMDLRHMQEAHRLKSQRRCCCYSQRFFGVK